MELKYFLKSQANEVFESITTAGLEPSAFEWRDITGHQSGQTVSQLVHKASGYYFTFDNVTAFYSKWSPGAEKLIESEGSSAWGSQLTLVRKWLAYLKRETESPDLWGAISGEAKILESAASADTSNVPFSAEEKAYMLNGLNEIKQHYCPVKRSWTNCKFM